MELMPEEITKLLLAVLLGGLIGAEREYRHRAAGFRTIIFICLGATMFTMFSLRLGGEVSPVRIAAHMVTGVGFLCAGVVLEEGAHIVGLTTASTIWLAASVGMGVGGGQYLITSTAVGVILIILWTFPKIEEWIYNFREGRTYEVVLAIDKHKPEQLESVFQRSGLRVKNKKILKCGEEMTVSWEAYGAPEGHSQLMEDLLADQEVKEFKC